MLGFFINFKKAQTPIASVSIPPKHSSPHKVPVLYLRSKWQTSMWVNHILSPLGNSSIWPDFPFVTYLQLYCMSASLTYFYHFLLPSLPFRLSQRSRHFGGSFVSGWSHLVPWSGRSAHLETAGHHPRQTRVCQIWGRTDSCQVGHG